ncbi:MAG: hypothetical protein N2484_16605 [Clostridia bacterium]|nr:hypothetical protein [Clostridia bacterium]
MKERITGFLAKLLLSFMCISVLAACEFKEQHSATNSSLNAKSSAYETIDESLAKSTGKKEDSASKEDGNTGTPTVKIKGHLEAPKSMNDMGSLILKGTSTGEFIEIIVKGEIFDFRHCRVEWDNQKNDVVEKEVLNKLDLVKNQTIIIQTYMPEGIPMEKIKWKGASGKDYEFVIHQNGEFGDNQWETVSN